MKHSILSPFARLLAGVLLFSGASLRAQDKPKEDPKPADEQKEDGEGDSGEEGDGQSGEEMTPEERAERVKEIRAAEKAMIAKMMTVFKQLEGTWTGEEKLEYLDKSQKGKSWKDEWTGKFTFGGRYFEMDGQTEGDEPSAYRWVCTWDPDTLGYRAWYFGDNSTTEYSGELNKSATAVVWKTETTFPSGTYTSEFTMEAKGHRVECSGTDKLDGKAQSRQSSKYTRKRISL